MNPMPELAPMLKRLRLSGILETLPARNQEAIDNKLAYSEFLALPCPGRGRTQGTQKVQPAACDARASAARKPSRASTSPSTPPSIRPSSRTWPPVPS